MTMVASDEIVPKSADSGAPLAATGVSSPPGYFDYREQCEDPG
jgi:hypothetical protein